MGVYAAGTEDASSTNGAGSALPCERTVVLGAVISVTDWVPVPG